MKSEYDLNSAVTFFLVGLGIGTVMALLCRAEMGRISGSEKISNRRINKPQAVEQVMERLA